MAKGWLDVGWLDGGGNAFSLQKNKDGYLLHESFAN